MVEARDQLRAAGHARPATCCSRRCRSPPTSRAFVAQLPARLRGRAEPRRRRWPSCCALEVPAHAATHPLGAATTTGCRSTRSSSPTRSCAQEGATAADAVPQGACAMSTDDDDARRRRRAATRNRIGLTTRRLRRRARPRCARAAGTTRSPAASSRPRARPGSSRTGSPSSRASAARARRRPTSSATRTASTPCTAACRASRPACTPRTASCC